MQTSIDFTAVNVAAGFAASTFAGSYLSGASYMDVATSLTGAAGATVGLVAGLAVAPMLPASVLSMQSAPLLITVALAVAVPGLASGTWNSTTFALGLAAVGGAYIAQTVMAKTASGGK